MCVCILIYVNNKEEGTKEVWGEESGSVSDGNIALMYDFLKYKLIKKKI